MILTEELKQEIRQFLCEESESNWFQYCVAKGIYGPSQPTLTANQNGRRPETKPLDNDDTKPE